MSRALRQICRQINYEVEHEQRKIFERQIDALQEQWKSLILRCDRDKYHVDMVLSFARVYGPMSRKNGLLSFWGARRNACGLVTSFLRTLPTTTRSVGVTIDLPSIPQGVLPFGYFMCFKMELGQYFRGMWDRVRAGEVELRSYSVVFECPTVLVPRLHLGFSIWRLRWIKLAGMSSDYDRFNKELCMHNMYLLRKDQRYLFLKRAIFALLPHIGRVEYALIYE